MKVEWLDVERTRAKITRGLLWWKRVTYVHKPKAPGYWLFELSGRSCPSALDGWLDAERTTAEKRDRARGHESEWQRPTRLPRAEIAIGSDERESRARVSTSSGTASAHDLAGGDHGTGS